MTQYVSPSEWAEIALADPKTVILDTETTSLPRRGRPEFIIEIAAIAKGQTLINTLVDPEWLLHEEACEVARIAPSELVGQPTFRQIAGDLAKMLHGKHILAWNAPFDKGIIEHEARRLHRTRGRRYNDTVQMLFELVWFDPCNIYRKWLREHNLYEPGAAKLNGPHRARGDCLAVVTRLREMAAHPLDNSSRIGNNGVRE